ncbi:GGDEF domain-containing protein [Desulfogranum marinum]|uniref:GGDEF domain-containing protein n=1 Tax=Desulfogranum marinum TaxID=453220 RepID=UPI0029C79742|nr:GGDEF domain-containing protein [Desulfogranum marinum]
MVIKSEELLESLLDLEKSRKREQDLRMETEALLQGLHGMARSRKKDELFKTLTDALHNVVDFEDAFILEMAEDNNMTVLASTCLAVENSIWEPKSVFNRVLAGRPIASFDIHQVPEWQAQPDNVKANIASALHIGLHSGGLDAIFIITHSSIKHFGTGHVKKANRFAPLASQALLTLELQQKVVQRDRFFKLSLDLMAIIDTTGILRQYNDVWQSLLGYGVKDVYGKRFLDFIHPEDAESIEAILHYLKKKERKELIEVRFQTKEGSYLWFSCSLASHQNEQLCYIVARDITDSILYRQRLAYTAEHDSLTGLINRGSFLSRINQEFSEAAEKEDYIFAIFFLDLNKFKTINDTLGHDVGDELLKTFAKKLQQVVHGRDVVARLGGDEFTILLTELQSPQNATSVADRIQTKFLHPVELKGHSIKISTSIGIALSSTQYSDAEEMLSAADHAMYQAKSDQSVEYVIG